MQLAGYKTKPKENLILGCYSSSTHGEMLPGCAWLICPATQKWALGWTMASEPP
jgi:hypothetical protein